jgi:hypothetical protein
MRWLQNQLSGQGRGLVYDVYAVQQADFGNIRLDI